MSTFGDNTPKEELYQQCKYVIRDYHLTFAQFMQMIMEVIAYIAEYSKSNFEEEA